MEDNRDVEEISLRELIETLIKGKKIIAGLLIAAVLLSFVGSMILKDRSQTAKIVISLNFEGIEEGLNPDGSKFDIQKLRSPAVILDAINSLEYSDYKFNVEDVRRNIIIDSIVPNHIVTYIQEQRKEGNDFTYFPNEFTVSLKADKSVGLDVDTSKNLLDGIINSYADYFNSLYSGVAVLANSIGSIDYSEYDYPEISRVVNNQVFIMKSYLNGKANEAPDFRSNITGMTFIDIIKSLEIIESVELNRMDSLIGAFNLTKNMEKLIINYEYSIKQNDLQKKKKANWLYLKI